MQSLAIYAYLMFRFLSSGPVITAAQSGGPIVSEIRETTFKVSFASIANAVQYYVTVSQRHGSSSTTVVCTEDTEVTISGLIGGTLYYVGVQVVGRNNQSLGLGNTTTIRTKPTPPTILTSTPLPTSVFLFMNARNSARVTKWEIEYRKAGDSASINTTTMDGTYYGKWLEGLTPNTQYEFRARASELKGVATTVTECPFGAWTIVITDALSIFGKYSTSETSSDVIRGELEGVYSTFSNYVNVTVVEKDSAASLAHFQIKVSDESLPAAGDFTGVGLSGLVMNNGDVQKGEAYIDASNPNRRDFYYISSMCSGLQVSRSVILSDENLGTYREIQLVPEGTNPTGVVDIALSDEKIKNGTNGVNFTINSNTLHGIDFKYLVKDCSRNQTGETLYFLLYRGLDGSIAVTDQPEVSFLYTTGIVPSDVRVGNITYFLTDNGTTVTLGILAVDKAILYEIVEEIGGVTTTLAMLQEDDIDGSETLKVKLPHLNNEAKTYKVRVTTRKHDGSSTTAVSSSSFNVTPKISECEMCSSDAICVVNLRAMITCVCLWGFEGNGTTCRKRDICNASPLPSQNATSPSYTEPISITNDILPTDPILPTETTPPSSSSQTSTTRSSTKPTVTTNDMSSTHTLPTEMTLPTGTESTSQETTSSCPTDATDSYETKCSEKYFSLLRQYETDAMKWRREFDAYKESENEESYCP